MNFALIPIWLLVFAISGSIHEFAHAWTAWKLGDDTGVRQGRLTLDPRAHVDPIGLFVLFISALVGIGFGWMRPVEVSPYRFANPKAGLALVAFAGPVSNLLQALLLTILARALSISPVVWGPLGVETFFGIAITLNLILAAFNLLPLAPLDGFAVLTGILPTEASLAYEKFAKAYGPLVLIAIFIIPEVQRVTLIPLYRGLETLVIRLAGG